MKSNFRGLLAWQKAMDLVDQIYCTVSDFPRHELFGLSSQMKRAAVRIPSDIAEGSGRWNLLDFRRFLRDARGSAYELETQIIVAQRQRYILAARRDELAAQCLEVTRLDQRFDSVCRETLAPPPTANCQLPTVNCQPRRSTP
jgi:four helix bundle protein